MGILVNARSKVLLQVVGAPDAWLDLTSLPVSPARLVGAVVTGVEQAPSEADWLLSSLRRFNSLTTAVAETGATVLVILAESSQVAAAAEEAAAAGLETVVAFADDIAFADQARLAQRIENSHTLFLGPGCREVVAPGECHIGQLSGPLATKGKVAVLSQCGYLSSLVTLQTSTLGVGQSDIVTLEQGPFRNAAFRRCLQVLGADPNSKGLVVVFDRSAPIDEETLGILAAIAATKPVIAHIVESADAAPLLENGKVHSFSTQAKLVQIERLREAGVTLVAKPTEIGNRVKAALIPPKPAAQGHHPFKDFVTAMRSVEQECY